MRLFAKKEPLTEAELSRLEEFLTSAKRSRTISVEELDGFFAALITGPEVVMPGEYLPEIIGGDGNGFESLDEANEILALLMRHWNRITATLAKDEVYLPVLLEDEHGVALGNEWARGFMRGVALCGDSWKELFMDESHADFMVPMLTLYHEHDEDPALRPPPIGPEQRGKIVADMTVGLLAAHRYFRYHRQTSASECPQEDRRVGRNDRCPCGSGKKWKRCCGANAH